MELECVVKLPYLPSFELNVFEKSAGEQIP